MEKRFTIGLVRTDDLPKKMAQLTVRSFFDIFSVKYLRAKYKHVCAVPFWWWWRVDRKGSQQFEIPKHQIDECVASSERFVSIPICLVSPEAPGGHANMLVLDKIGVQSQQFSQMYGTSGKGTIERFEPHGARAYEMFNDYYYEHLDEQLAFYFATEYGLEYIAPIDYCPALGPQSMERYISESGYCATWSLWYIDMRLAYPNVDRRTLVKGMFDKLHDLLSAGELENYLVDYAKQVYAVMVSEFPHYRDFFINFDAYKKLPRTNKTRRAFDKFVQEMEGLVHDPLYINAPVFMHAVKIPAPISPDSSTKPVVIPPGKMYKTKEKKVPLKKKSSKKTPTKKTVKKKTSAVKKKKSKSSVKRKSTKKKTYSAKKKKRTLIKRTKKKKTFGKRKRTSRRRSKRR